MVHLKFAHEIDEMMQLNQYSYHPIASKHSKEFQLNSLLLIFDFRVTFAARDIVESDSSADDDCPPTLLTSPQIIGLLFV